MKNTTVKNITYSDRAVRIVAGFGMIYSVILQSGPIGAAAILPLAAIYPIMTGFIGWDPIVEFITTRRQRSNNQLNGAVVKAG